VNHCKQCQTVKVYDNEWRCMVCFRQFVPIEESIADLLEQYTGIEIINQEDVEDERAA